MPLNFLIRAAGIAGVIAMSTRLSALAINSLYVAFVLGHFLTSFIYSKKRLLAPASGPDFLVLIACGLTAFFRFPDIVLYFGVHYALTEVYWINKMHPQWSYLTPHRFLLNAFGYLFMLRHEKAIAAVPGYFWAVGLVGALVYFFYGIHKRRVSARNLVDTFLFEAAAMLPIVLSIFFEIKFWNLLVYHTFIWIFIPAVKKPPMKWHEAFSYWLLTSLLTTGILLLTPLGGGYLNVPLKKLDDAVVFWGYMHITSSFMLSSYNPEWVTRLFRWQRKTAFSNG